MLSVRSSSLTNSILLARAHTIPHHFWHRISKIEGWPQLKWKLSCHQFCWPTHTNCWKYSGNRLPFFFFFGNREEKAKAILVTKCNTRSQEVNVRGGGNYCCATYSRQVASVPGYSPETLLVTPALQADILYPASLSSLPSQELCFSNQNGFQQPVHPQCTTLNKWLHK